MPRPLSVRQAFVSPRGFAALITILLISAAGIAIVVALLFLGIGSTKMSLAYEQSLQARWLATTCTEEALQQIRDSTSFTGSGTMTLGQGTCTYSVTSQGGQNRTIEATGTVGTLVRKVETGIDQINPTINIVSWREVADF